MYFSYWNSPFLKGHVNFFVWGGGGVAFLHEFIVKHLQVQKIDESIFETPFATKALQSMYK